MVPKRDEKNYVAGTGPKERRKSFFFDGGQTARHTQKETGLETAKKKNCSRARETHGRTGARETEGRTGARERHGRQKTTKKEKETPSEIRTRDPRLNGAARYHCATGAYKTSGHSRAPCGPSEDERKSGHHRGRRAQERAPQGPARVAILFRRAATKSTQHEIAKTPAARVYTCRNALGRGRGSTARAGSLGCIFATTKSPPASLQRL